MHKNSAKLAKRRKAKAALNAQKKMKEHLQEQAAAQAEPRCVRASSASPLVARLLLAGCWLAGWLPRLCYESTFAQPTGHARPYSRCHVCRDVAPLCLYVCVTGCA